MLDTSKDFLNIVIAVSIFGLAMFISWSIFYFVQILRQIFKIIKEMRDRLHKIDELFSACKEKVENSTSNLVLISEGVKKIVEVVKDYTAKKAVKKKAKKKK